MAKIKGLIWAGNAEQAKQYCFFRGFDPSEYPYITSANSIRGLRVDLIIRVGTYWNHRDCREIDALVKWFNAAGTYIKTVFDEEWKPV